jgi:large subunit ribosomal protein L17
MRHRKSGVKLNRTSSHRKAMFRNMVTSLFKHERIRTTDAKAKELRRWADHLVTLAKRGDLHARRQAMAIVREKAVVHKLFDEVVQRYQNVAGGYTRIVKIGVRPGDAAPISMIELVTPEPKPAKKKPTKKKAKPAETKAKDQTAKAKPAPKKSTKAQKDEPPAQEEGIEETQATEGVDAKKTSEPPDTTAVDQPEAAAKAADAKATKKKAPAKKPAAKKKAKDKEQR